MSELMNGFELETSTGGTLPLKGAHVDARLFGLLAVVELKQQWCNNGTEAIEALYTFPLAGGAQLIGLSMTIGERSLEGQVQPKSKATASYEEAISEGQRAALVMDVGNDLKQISLGNIQPGDAIGITLRWVEPLRWSDKNLRWRLPTVIAPRYGDPRKAGLTADQMPHTDLAASFNLTLKVRLEGELAHTKVSCPTHSIAVSRTDNQLELQLAADARLDRDFVLNLQADLPQGAELWNFRDGKGDSALLSFQPPMIAKPMEAGQNLVVLVDCSGSMIGDSIKQAREGLKAYLGMARPQDRLSIIRFGSDIAHCTPEPVLLDEKGRKLLVRKIDREVHADLGGTEIIEALQAAIRVAGPNGQILLITDGEVYTSEEDIIGVVAGKCRIFPVGVGAAVTEQFLRDLADKTGGYCELVTPNENMAQVISAQCRRLTLSPVTAEIEWQQEPEWAESAPEKMFVGDSVLLAVKGNELAISGLTLGSEGIRQPMAVQRRELDAALGEVLRRYCSARRLPTLSDEAATALAVDEGLLCKHTAMVAVDTEKHATDGLPQLVEVPQMMAAGSHGYGSVRTSSLPMMSMSVNMCSRESISYEMSASYSSEESVDLSADYLDIPLFLRRSAKDSEESSVQAPAESSPVPAIQLDADWPVSAENPTVPGELDLGVQLTLIAEFIESEGCLSGAVVQVLAGEWRQLLSSWRLKCSLSNLSEVELLASFIISALGQLPNGVSPEHIQLLRRAALRLIPHAVTRPILNEMFSTQAHSA